MSKWLPERSVDAVRAALALVCPNLADAELTLRSWLAAPDPAWYRGSAFVDGQRLVVKFAWSAPAAAKLEREVHVLVALSDLADGPPLPAVVAASTEPVLLVYRFEPGRPLTGEFVASCTAQERNRLAESLARTLAAFHHPATMAALVAASIPLGPPVPQATTDALRDRLCPRLSAADRAAVSRWCDWTDRVLNDAVEAVAVHGDFHGQNLVIDRAQVRAVLDMEEIAAGDRSYDFRYLPAQEATLGLFRATMAEYERNTGVGVGTDRVMAWHVRTVLGDALWRTEAGTALPDRGTVRGWIAALARRFDALGINPAP